jgi:O-antigen ligase
VFSSLQTVAYFLSDGSLIMKFIQFILYSGIFALVYQMDFSRSAIKHLFVLMLVVGALEGCVGALQWARGPGIYVIGTLGGHNVFSSYMALMTLLVAGVALEARRSAVRLAAIAAIVIMVYSIIFSFSRMAYVSLLVSFLTFGLMPIARRKRVAIPAATVVATAITLAIVPISVLERMRGILLTATGKQTVLSFRFRLEMWRDAFGDFMANPIFGTGTSETALKDNFFVKAAAETGLLGLGSFLVLIYLVLRASWRSVADPPRDDFMRGIMVGFFPAAVGALIVFNLAGDFITINRFIGVFWIALALILRYREAGEDTDRHLL